MRKSLPPVRLQMHPSVFDLMMTVLEDNAATAPDEESRDNANRLMEKCMKYSRLCSNSSYSPYVSVRMYESEAAQMIWQLLIAACDHYGITREYSKELDGGDTDGGQV